MHKLHFKKSDSGHYPFLFYIGKFFVPVEAPLLKELKSHAGASPGDFLKFITERLGSNPYLRSEIQEAIKESDHPADLAGALRAELETLKAP